MLTFGMDFIICSAVDCNVILISLGLILTLEKR